MVRLSGGQRRGGQEHRQPRELPGARRLHRQRQPRCVLRVGCFNRGTPCSVDTGGAISHILHGSDVTINDPTPPTVTVEASGLLAGGARNGSDPVTLTASDGAGIRSVELLDVTDPAAPAVVGVEDYAAVRTDANRVCDYSQPAPCPSLSRETVRADRAARRPAHRDRARDRHRRQRRRAAARTRCSPSRRPTAARSTAPAPPRPARCRPIWTVGGKSDRRTLSYGTKAGVRGRLLNSDGQPITGAKVLLLTRDLRQGAALIPRTTVTTDGDGTLPRHGHRLRLAAAAVRLALARQRHPLRRQRLPDAAGARRRRALKRLDAPPARRPHAHDQRRAARRLARRRAGGRPGPRARLAGATRRSPTRRRRQRPLQGHATASAARPRAGARFVFRARIRPAAALPLRDGLFADRRPSECAEK